MKKNYWLPLLSTLLFTGSFSACGQERQQDLTVMTWNIRMNSPGDGVNAWPNRKEKVISFLQVIKPPVLCMQEVLAMQLDDLNKGLPQYGWFGAGRDDGKREGEYVPVFYLKERFDFLKGDNFWLSDTPDKPGKLGWDAVCPRMVTWVKLADRMTGNTLFIFNTHFDHIGVNARLQSAKLLTHAADSIAGNNQILITGDFNSAITDTPYAVITGAGFQDSRLVSVAAPAGPEYTFTGFATSGKPGDRIDYIYVRNTQPVKSYLVRNDSSDGYYLSDHLPVMVKL